MPRREKRGGEEERESQRFAGALSRVTGFLKKRKKNHGQGQHYLGAIISSRLGKEGKRKKGTFGSRPLRSEESAREGKRGESQSPRQAVAAHIFVYLRRGCRFGGEKKRKGTEKVPHLESSSPLLQDPSRLRPA